MIFITAKFQVKAEDADRWPVIAAGFTAATRAEPGCLWFDWSRSLDDPNEYVLVEAFADDAAGAAHVTSEHFKKAQQALPPHLVRTPKIVNFTVPQDDWSLLGEMAVPGSDLYRIGVSHARDVQTRVRAAAGRHPADPGGDLPGGIAAPRRGGNGQRPAR